MKSLLFIGIISVLVACSSKPKTTPKPVSKPSIEINQSTESDQDMKPEETVIIEEEDFTALKVNVSLGVSPLRPNWVLYKNGTYMLFRDPLANAILEEAAHKRILAIESFNNLTSRKSQLATGWIVTFGNSGIYNYVEKDAISEGIPSDNDIKNIAINNVKADQIALEIIHFNKKKS